MSALLRVLGAHNLALAEDGFSTGEIARALLLGEAAVEKQLVRGRQLLQPAVIRRELTCSVL